MPIVETNWVPIRAEIIFINHSPALGKEIPEYHPLLVASPKRFNEQTGFVIGFPMTHADFHSDNPMAKTITCRAKTLGVMVPSYVLGFQPKSFDWRARNAKRHAWGVGYEQELEDMLNIFDSICRLPEI